MRLRLERFQLDKNIGELDSVCQAETSSKLIYQTRVFQISKIFLCRGKAIPYNRYLDDQISIRKFWHEQQICLRGEWQALRNSKYALTLRLGKHEGCGLFVKTYL